MLIGLAGRARSGKGTIAEHLVNHYGFTKCAYSDPLKEMLIKAGMCTHEECYGEKTPMIRWLMQKIGTDIFKKQVDPFYWVKATYKKVQKLLDEGKDVVVDDIRFSEEAWAIRSLGGVVVKVERLNNDGSQYHDPSTDSSHISESTVDKIPCNYVIKAKSGDIKSLKNAIDKIIKGMNTTPFKSKSRTEGKKQKPKSAPISKRYKKEKRKVPVEKVFRRSPSNKKTPYSYKKKVK